MTDDWSHQTGVEYQVREFRLGSSQNVSVITISESTYSLLRILTSAAEKRFLNARYRLFDGRRWMDNPRALNVQVVGIDCPVIAAYLQAEEKEVFGTERITVAPDTESLRKGRIRFPLSIAKWKDFHSEANSVDGWSYRLFKLNVFYPSLLDDDTQRFQEYFDDACIFGRSLTILRPEGADNSLMNTPAPPPQSEAFGDQGTQPPLGPTSSRDIINPDSQSVLHAGRAGGASVMQLVAERTSGATSVTRLQDYNRASGRSSMILENARPNASLAYIGSDARPSRLESVVQLGGSDLPSQRLGSTMQYAISEKSVHRLGSSFQSSSTSDLPSRLGSTIQQALPDDVPYRLGSTTQNSSIEQFSRFGSSVQRALPDDVPYRLDSAAHYSSYNDQPSRLGTSFQYTFQGDVSQRLGTARAEYNTPYEGPDLDKGNGKLHLSVRKDSFGGRLSPTPDPIQRNRTPVNGPLRPPTRTPSPPSTNQSIDRYPWHHPLRTCNNNSIAAQFALKEAIETVSSRQRHNYHARFKAEYDAQYEFHSRAWSPFPESRNAKYDYNPRPVIVDVLIMNLADALTPYPSQSNPYIPNEKHMLLQTYLEKVWEHLTDLPSILSSEGTAYVVLPAASVTTVIMMALKERICQWSTVQTVWNVVTVGVTRGGEEVLCIWKDDATSSAPYYVTMEAKSAEKVTMIETISNVDEVEGSEPEWWD
jgi:hypothetical protein